MEKRSKKEKPGIRPSLADQIIRIILRYKATKRIVFFGSRARGDFKPESDIDLAVVDEAWTDTDVNLAKHALEEELKTPCKIDLVNFYALTKPQLKQGILKEGKTLYESKKDRRAYKRLSKGPRKT